MSPDLVFKITFGASLVLGALAAWRSRGPAYERALAGLIPAILSVVGMVVLVDVATGFIRPWNNARLAPTEAWLHGYATYYIDDGPILGTMYTPLSYWFYLPAVLFPTPYEAVFAGLVLTLIYTLLPGLVVIDLVRRRKGLSAIWSIGLGLLFVLVHFVERGLMNKGVWVHVDQPGQALLITGFGIIYLMGPDARRWLVYLAAGCVVLTPWCKQTFVPFVLIAPAVVWLLYGKSLFFRYCFATVALGLFTCVVSLLTVDFQAMWFNAFMLPGTQPWIIRGWNIPAIGVMVAVWSSSLSLLLIGLLAIFERPEKRGQVPFPAADEPAIQDRSAHPLFARRRPLILAVPVLFAVPFACIGLAKNGSDWNHVAPIAQLVLLGAILYVVDRVREVSKAGIVSYANAVTVVLPIGFLLATSILAFESRFSSLNPAWRAYFNNPEMQAFELAKLNRHRIYFPFHPMTTLKSEGIAYHLSDGIINRMMADIRISKSQFADGLPEDLSVIAVYTGNDAIMDFLPEFSEKTVLPAYPGWVFFRKKAVIPALPPRSP